MIGITAWGAYVPRLRLSRKAVVEANRWIAPNLAGKSKGERAMTGWDEDSITMAVEACRDALDEDRSAIDALYFASTTAPFADRLNGGIVAAALTLERSIACVDVSGCQRSGLTALGQAMGAVAAGTARNALVAGADHRRAPAASVQELDWGDAGAAFVVGSESVAAEFLGHASITADFVDHFRGSSAEFDYFWEERWVRDEGLMKLVPPAVTTALGKAGIAADQVSHFCLPSTFAGVSTKIAAACGVASPAVRDALALRLGEAGCAHGLLMLADALESAAPGEIIVAAQFGQGCEVLVFRATELVADKRPPRGLAGSLSDRKEENNYLKFLFFNDLVKWDKGMRAEKDAKTSLSTLYRNSDAILGLVGGRCTETGIVQFPRSRISVAPGQPNVDTQVPYKFADRRARLMSWSADYLTFSNAPPSHYGMVDFEGGGRIHMDITDVGPGDVTTGMPLRMVFRIKEVDAQRGFRRYFWKACPDRLRIAQEAGQGVRDANSKSTIPGGGEEVALAEGNMR